MHTFHDERLCTVNISLYLPEYFDAITSNTVAQMLDEEYYLQDEEYYLQDIHTIQIPTCHRFISICFNTKENLLTFCETLLQIFPDITYHYMA